MLTAVIVGVLILLAALYLNRRMVAREILVGWLDRQGIAAEVEVERISLSRSADAGSALRVAERLHLFLSSVPRQEG